MPTAAAAAVEVVVEGRAVGQAERRQPAVDVADDVDPVSSRSNSLHGGDAEMTATSDAGTFGATSRSPSTSASESTPTDERAPLVSPRWVRMCQSCSKKSPSPFSIAEQLRDLADHDRQRQADDEALQHRLGDEAGEEAEAEQPGDERERRPSMNASAAGEGERSPSGPPVARSATAAADSAAVAAIGPMTRCRELPNAAYSSSAGGAAYRPTTGETPAIVA